MKGFNWFEFTIEFIEFGVLLIILYLIVDTRKRTQTIEFNQQYCPGIIQKTTAITSANTDKPALAPVLPTATRPPETLQQTLQLLP